MKTDRQQIQTADTETPRRPEIETTPMSTTLTTFSTLDSRKRLNLATIATRDSYRVTREESGRIILDPAVVLTEAELAVLSDPATREAVEVASQSTERRPRRRL